MIFTCHYLHLTRGIAEAKCILVMAVCLSLAAFPHYYADLDITWGNGRGCPVVVHGSVPEMLTH